MNEQYHSSEIEKRFALTGSLSLKKLLEYLPATILTNISSLLLVTVDGVVVGNYVGKDALAAVTVLSPVTILIGAFSVLAGTGIGTALSLGMGENSRERLNRIKTASLYFMIISALLVSLIQIPIVFGLVRSYGLSEQIKNMIMRYSIGIMISTPFGLISLVGTNQLIVTGRMKTLVWLSVLEGGVNTVLDLLFVGVFHMGIEGAGYGTLAANVIRCSATLIYIMKVTDIYRGHDSKPAFEEMKNIISLGLPEFAQQGLTGLQGYVMTQVILYVFGSDGGVIKGVTLFCFSLIRVIVNGVIGSMRPLVGLMSGAKDTEGLRLVVRQGLAILFALALGFVLLVQLDPSLFYRLNGVDTTPDWGDLSLRLFSFYFIVEAFNTVLRLYFTNRKDTNYATVTSVTAKITLPVIAVIMATKFAAPFIWLSYPLTESVFLIINLIRYEVWNKRDRAVVNDRESIFYLTIKPGEAVEASRMIRAYADEHGYPSRLAYRVSLCMEEMVAYCVAVSKGADVTTQNVIRLTDTEAVFVIIDNGRCIALDKDTEDYELVTDNYELIKRLASSLDYQYILNMNYTVVKFLMPSEENG